MTQSQIRYYVNSESENDDAAYHPDGHTTNLLIINRRDKIPGILQKLNESLAPVESALERTSGKITNSDFNYQLLSIQSRGNHPEKLDWTLIFRGKITKDRELRERTKKDALEIYVDSHINQLSS